MAGQLVAIQAFDSNGVPAAGAKFFTYAAGTTTPKAAYSDEAGTIALSNPVVCNAAGIAACYLKSGIGDYKIALKDSTGAIFLFRTIDNYSPDTDSILYIIGSDIETARTEALDAATAAQLAQSLAETARAAAEAAQLAAENAETGAASSVSAAAASASAAATSATNAATSASAASTSASAAATAKTNAETAETNAETAETNAEAAQAAAEAARALAEAAVTDAENAANAVLSDIAEYVTTAEDTPVPSAAVWTFNPATAVNTGTDKIARTAHPYADGQLVKYAHGGGTAIGGLTTATLYYIKSPGANDFQLSATRGGAAINLTSTGAGTAHTLADVFSLLHYAEKAQDSADAAQGHEVGAAEIVASMEEFVLGSYANATAAWANPSATANQSIYYNTTAGDWRVLGAAAPQEAILAQYNTAYDAILTSLDAGTLPSGVIADQATAEAGSNNTKGMTPLRVAQAIAVLSPPVPATVPNQTAKTVLTINGSGSITPIYGSHEIAGAGAAADDLSTIDMAAFVDGGFTILRPTTDAYAITVKASGGNITTDTGVDITLNSHSDLLFAVKDGSTARVSKVSRDAPSASSSADVANVTALKAIVTASGLSDGARINLLGYTSVGDGGGGVLTYIAASTATPDDFRVFKPNDVTLPAAGRFVRVAQPVYDWRQAGCVLDGSTNDAARANVAAADTAVAAITGGGKVMGLNYTSGGALVIDRNDLTVEDTEFKCLQPTSTTDNRVVRNNGDRNTFRRCRFNWGTAGIAVGSLGEDALFWNTGDDCTMDQCYATGDRKGSGFVNNAGTNFRCIKPIIESLRFSSTPTASTAVSGVSGANLTVSSITGFTNGSRIFVLMNDGGYHETTINGAPSGTTIVMAATPTRSSVDTTGGLVVCPSTTDDAIQAIWNNAATAAYIDRPVIRNITGDIGFGQYSRFTRGIANGGCNGVDIMAPFVDTVDQGIDNTGSAANKGIRVIGGKIQNVRTWGVKHANSIIDCVVEGVLVENAGLACVVYSGPAESGLTVKTSRCTVANSILKNPGWGSYSGSDNHSCVTILKSTYDQDFPKGIKVQGVRGVDDQATTTARRLFFSDVTQRAAYGDDFNELDEFCTFDYSGDGVSLNAENVAGAEAPVCSLYLSSSQSIPNATWTEILFNAEEYDPAQMHSTVSATGRIVIKRRGLYWIAGAARFANNATGGRNLVLRFESSNIYGGANQVAGHSTLSTYARAAGYRYCEPSDEIYMWVYQDSGGALNALDTETWLSAIRMPMNF